MDGMDPAGERAKEFIALFNEWKVSVTDERGGEKRGIDIPSIANIRILIIYHLSDESNVYWDISHVLVGKKYQERVFHKFFPPPALKPQHFNMASSINEKSASGQELSMDIKPINSPAQTQDPEDVATGEVFIEEEKVLLRKIDWQYDIFTFGSDRIS